VTNYDNDIRRFMDAMRYKLDVHKGKGRWEDMSIEKAMELLMGEVEELGDAIRKGNLIEVMLEAADVANFAMIISTIMLERGRDHK
jgi:NTP pyrophosphatase (non-canonical NTP hydrolase)